MRRGEGLCVAESGSPVVLGVTVDGFCKHVHRLAVLALLEHLNALHWRMYTQSESSPSFEKIFCFAI